MKIFKIVIIIKEKLFSSSHFSTRMYISTTLVAIDHLARIGASNVSSSSLCLFSDTSSFVIHLMAADVYRATTIRLICDYVD